MAYFSQVYSEEATLFVFLLQNEISYQFPAPKGILPESPIPEIWIETELENGTYVTSPVEDSDVQLPPSIGHCLPTITVTSDHVQPVPTANGHPLHSLPASNGHSNGRSLPSTTNGHSLPSANGRPLNYSNGRAETSSNGRAFANPQPMPASATTRIHRNTSSQHSSGASEKSSRSGRTREYIEDDPPPPYPLSESPRGAKTKNQQQNQNSSTQFNSTNHPQSHQTSSPCPPANATATGRSVAKKTMSTKAKGMDNNLYRAMVLEGFQGITGKVTPV